MEVRFSLLPRICFVLFYFLLLLLFLFICLVTFLDNFSQICILCNLWLLKSLPDAFAVTKWLDRSFLKCFKPINLPPFAYGTVCKLKCDFHILAVYNLASAFTYSLCTANGSAMSEKFRSSRSSLGTYIPA